MHEAIGLQRPTASSAKWYKLGTIDRVLRDEGSSAGRLHAIEKLIAVYLIGYARTTDADPSARVSENRISAELGLDRKTLRKYLDALERRTLIERRRDRDRGALTFYIGTLVSAFAEGPPLVKRSFRSGRKSGKFPQLNPRRARLSCGKYPQLTSSATAIQLGNSRHQMGIMRRQLGNLGRQMRKVSPSLYYTENT